MRGSRRCLGLIWPEAHRKFPAAFYQQWFLGAPVQVSPCNLVTWLLSAGLGEQSMGVETEKTPTPPTVPTFQRLQVIYSLSHLLWGWMGGAGCHLAPGRGRAHGCPGHSGRVQVPGSGLTCCDSPRR